MSSRELTSEALAHLQIQWEQFSIHVYRHEAVNGLVNQSQITDELKRIRNTLVLLEKSALVYVIKELLALLEQGNDSLSGNNDRLINVLGVAARRIAKHIAVLQKDHAMNSALGLVPLINDCRALRNETLLTDTLMLAAGVEAPVAQYKSGIDELWFIQRQVWIDYASSHHSELAKTLLHWWQDGHTGVVTALMLELDQFALVTGRHAHLHTLAPLFQAASVVAMAVNLQQLDQGPALRSLFVQLEQHVYRCTSITTPEDLLPHELLRNFLYYVAQSNSDTDMAVDLLHRFRLDRVRMEPLHERVPGTPTIGIVYHLTNAIRSGVTIETESLRSWLDSPGNKEFAVPKFARLRVRLGQLEPILTLMGSDQSVQCLQLVLSQLQDLRSKQHDGSGLQADLSHSLSELDSSLDQSARQSVLSHKTSDSGLESGDDVYIDMATDACLREARHDLQECAESLLPMMQSRVINTTIVEQLVGKFTRADNALQILPVPEVSPLFQSLNDEITDLLEHVEPSSGQNHNDSTDNAVESEQCLVTELLGSLLHSLDSYLGSVFYPQPVISQHLSDARNTLEQLQPVMRSMYSSFKLDSGEGLTTGIQSEQWLDDLSLPGIGSLTLNIDDELLLEPLAEEDHSALDSTLQLVSRHAYLDHLDTLDESVRLALGPGVGSEVRLPNEQMLRALHTLTDSAQSTDTKAVVLIAQPLQRVSLALYREGQYFDADQIRIVGDLMQSLRVRMATDKHEDRTDTDNSDIENMLSELLTQVNGGLRQPSEDSSDDLASTNNSDVSSLSDVFAEEASIILDQLHDTISGHSFNEKTQTDALALLHTLKGSARIAGHESICKCAHILEKEIQSLDTSDERLQALEQGYWSLQSDLLQIKTRYVSKDPGGISSRAVYLGADTYGQISDVDAGTSRLLEMATDLTFNQAQVSDEFERLSAVCDDIHSGTMGWRELRRNGDLPNSPALNEMIADMEASRVMMMDALQQALRKHLQSSALSATLQHTLVRSQLVRVDDVRARLTATIDDVARHCGVSARLQMSGGEMMIERRIYKQLIAPLEHLARNAIVHGIESAESRKSFGKLGVGVISLDARMDGTDLVLRFSDDGRGVSSTVMETLCNELGHTREPADAEIQELLFSAGFSSLPHADVVAGHGLGLSAVKTMIEQLEGQVQLDDIGEQGFSVTLRIPQELVVNQVILVQSDERFYGIPVAQTRSVQLENELSNIEADGSNTLSIGLQTLLGKPEPRPSKMPPHEKPSVWVDVFGECLSIEVDKVVGYRELLIQPLGPQLGSLRRYSCGSVLSNGQQVLIVDLSSLPDKTESEQPASLPVAFDASRPIALVVDDSPTTRRMAQSLLQRRGIEVLSCRDGLEALERISIQLPHIMIIDLEMPQMDGFTLVRRIKAQYGEDVPPFIMASSRDDKPNREMARSLGAVKFLAKPYDETRLQEAVEAAGVRLPDLTIA